MNLLFDYPFDLVSRDGSQSKGTFARIADARYTDLWAPRADFRGAGFQFAIGILQLAFAPKDLDEWRDRWSSPPDEATLTAALAPYVLAFEFDTDGPAFMQDFHLPEAELKNISNLLIEFPGEKTVKDNLDHFVKRDTIGAICPACAAAALFTLQINAPSGGVGHRVSLRGGGPLTTLLIPNDPHASLWHKLWLNVLPEDVLECEPFKKLADVLPWMAATRTSDAKGVGPTTPETVHPLQAYWSMPRRIRLDFANTEKGCCDLCGAYSDRLLRQYRARNYGVNYTGAWLHPLTPYSIDPQKPPPLSIKGQRGGIGYRHWLGLTLGNADKKPAPAQVVQHFNTHLARKCPGRLWCFGYDMDNMKARCWYDSTLPVHAVEPAAQTAFAKVVRNLLDVAVDGASLLNKQVKAARSNRPGDLATDPAVPLSFWQGSEPGFYRVLERLVQMDPSDESAAAGLYRQWLLETRRLGLSLFDEWVQSTPIENANTRRVIEARAELLKWLNAGKVVRPLWKIVNTYHKEAA